MEEQVKILLEKYYEGTSSLEEEKELRGLLLKVSGYELEKQFFIGMELLKNQVPGKKTLPGAKGIISPWLKIAAVMLVFLGLTWLFVDHQHRRTEELAYTQVMEAFALIQENMLKGTASLDVLQDMKHLGKTNELFNIKEKEEK